MRSLLNWMSLRKESLKTERSSAYETLVVKRVWIEKTECIWFTLCEAESKGLVEFSKELGTSIVKEDSLQRTQQELQQLLEASKVCGVSAFYLETEDGRVLNLEDDEVQQSLRAGTYRWS